ncbi:MAG: sulfurtransferase complex subunit TusB [Sulfurimicrobium sp.]|nr:sulfurtransferase complex subunit TusB [Sulfurimicrobium sp.]MDO9189149.1 sulfurtransferase complex subunit TusB [Sulfurimicrobium sp.]MDP2198277.1 sulfurtransferase complex subunit TusB [Sulfurimicrobium sp.]MDP2964196.1 sulfurtransferase complex subunit TusB [Sulfurimicrobium sp.]MDP3687907.1 sulfurtransferase complex subunit TusB [Sulfurimicrobium sp.]
MLHIVNKSPLERNALDSALRMIKPGSTILLIEDAVYAVTKGNKVESAVKEAMKTCTVSALWPDLEARGMQDTVIDGVKQVDYSGFVDLVADSSSVMSWL